MNTKYRRENINPGTTRYMSAADGGLRNALLGRMAWKLIILLMIWSAAVMSPCDISAQTVSDASEEYTVDNEKLGKRESREAAEIICQNYKPWLRSSLSGKLHADGLPLSPSVKVSMEKDKSLYMSVRAPFVGEVFRVDMTQDKILIVNKMKRTYCELEYDDDHKILSSLQSLMLGRIVIVDEGELSKKNYKECEFYNIMVDSVAVGDEAVTKVMDGWSVFPPYIGNALMYAYGVDLEGRMVNLMVNADSRVVKKLFGVNDDASTEDKRNFERLLDIFVCYDNSGRAEAAINVTFGKYRFSAQLDADKPEYGAKPMQPAELSPKYREVRLREVIKF